MINEATKTVVAKKINHPEKDRIGLFFDYNRDTIKLPFARLATFVTIPVLNKETDIRIIRKPLLHSEIKTITIYTHESTKNVKNSLYMFEIKTTKGVHIKPNTDLICTENMSIENSWA